MQLFPPDSPPLQVCPLYSALPSKDQLKAFEKKDEENKKTRKIILATNIAEVRIVIKIICIQKCLLPFNII